MIDPVNLAIDNDNPFCKDKKIVKLTTTEKVRERRWANESRSEKANKCKDNMLAALLASHAMEANGKCLHCQLGFGHFMNCYVMKGMFNGACGKFSEKHTCIIQVNRNRFLQSETPARLDRTQKGHCGQGLDRETWRMIVAKQAVEENHKSPRKLAGLSSRVQTRKYSRKKVSTRYSKITYRKKAYKPNKVASSLKPVRQLTFKNLGILSTIRAGCLILLWLASK
jgi:hypothetical protein